MDQHHNVSNRAGQAKILVEKDEAGQPHEGKVFVAIHAHLDDVPYFAGGLCAKLMQEGYTGYIVRTTNDEKSGGHTMAQNILRNEQEHLKMAAALGFKDVIDLDYRNHRMNGVSAVELRGRLILILRMFKADTVLSFNPVDPGEDNADHLATGRAAGEACWMCGSEADFPEHLEAGLTAHPVQELYYFCTRPEQQFNCVVDIGPHIEKKIDAIVECKSQGGGNLGSELRARLLKEGKRLPLLGNDDRTADREYVRHFLLNEFREYGKPHSLQYAERFQYINRRTPAKSQVDEYVQKNAVRIG
ncbi:MAG TPA: PIG-L family deacetylase [Bryobacteraceae bacterium]|nr:PIG-L family deacetylase [Bryobacteraceae bacterium]